MPLNRQLLRKVQELLSRVSRGLGKGNEAAEEETKMLSARWASNASASGSASMTFASSPIPSSVQRSAPIVASLSWHDWSDHIDPLRRGSGTSSLPGGAGAAYRRSFFTRTPLLPLPAVAAGGGERKKKRNSSSSDRRRSSSSSSTTTLRPKRRIFPSEMPRLPQLSRRGQRQWRTLLEDEVRRFFFPPFSTSSAAAAAAHPSLSPSKTYPTKKQHPLREEDIPPEIRAIMNRLREAGEFDFAFCARSFSGNAKKSKSC